MSEQVVIVGVDGSPASYTALRWALGYTGRTGAAGADLLVVGHSPRYGSGMLHRSVSWYCAQHATCPVLVIPTAMATQRTLISPSAEVPA